MSDALIKTLRATDARLRQTETREVPGGIPGFTSFYDVGTFVPTFFGTITPGTWTYNVQAGFYTRIGNRCLFSLSLNAATRPGAPTGNARIVGLPFTSDATANSHSALAIDTVDAITLTGTIMQLTARVSPGTTYVEFIEVLGTAPTAAAALAATAFGATAFIRISGSYMV